MNSHLETVLAYHEATKHRFEKYARGPGGMDWVTQPDQFRQYDGAPLIHLNKAEPKEPSYAAVITGTTIPAAPITFESVSQLLYDSLALSAWKTAGIETWPLRINPSSGNLHPTECYVLCGEVEGLCQTPLICHYAPKEHGLEVRAKIPGQLWKALVEKLPADTILLGLTSIHWRESWKYGERAYRYCQLDSGHALGALALAAAAIGWEARLADTVASDDLAQLFGIADQSGPEAEEPDCLVAVFPAGSGTNCLCLNTDAVADFKFLDWQGRPNRLSRSHRDWKRISTVAEACRRERGRTSLPKPAEAAGGVETPPLNGSFRNIVRKRRSAVAMDGISSMQLVKFIGLLERIVSSPGLPPFNLLPWPPFVDLALFVHRVDDLQPGLYMLIRNERHMEELKELLDVEFLWQRPQSCPAKLNLFLLAAGDARSISKQIACFQDIASDGCFSLGMLTEFARPLKTWGLWLYSWFFRECGMIGQVLYLEAEAMGLRGTGIGCFFDDPMHELLGLEGSAYQDLYHFTVGGPVEDRRISTLPAYPAQMNFPSLE